MSLRKSFKTDAKAEIEGVDVTFGYSEHRKAPISFRVTRAGLTNKRWTKAIEEITSKYGSKVSDNEVARRLMIEAFVDGVLLGWTNVLKSELTGNPKDTEDLEFTRENAIALFTELPDLYIELQAKADDIATFRVKELAATAKN